VTKDGWEQVPILQDKLLEWQEKLLKAYKELTTTEEEKQKREAALTEAQKSLSCLNGTVYQGEEDAHVAKEVVEKAQDEAAQSREQAASAEETAAKAWEEAARYKGEAIDLDKGKRLVESDLAATQSNYARLKEALLKSEIARGAVEEAKKKAREDLEAEQACSRGLFDDIDRLKKALREKEDAILQSGKLIEDLRVDKTERARSYKKIEKANTDLVSENTTLEEKIRGKSSMLLCFLCLCGVPFLSSDSLSRSLQGLRMIYWQPRSTPSLLRRSSRERSN
jgi:tetratricopeptide (TPR) repeat protein